MTIERDVVPNGISSAVVYAPFDKGKAEIESAGYEIISLPVNAELRTLHGKDHSISRRGNWTREGILYIPGKGNRLVINSSILESVKEATEAHRNKRDFYPTNEQVENALKDSVEFPDRDIEIPVERFNEEGLTVYAFGSGDSQKAQRYGDFLKSVGISSMPVRSVDKNYVAEQNTPFERLAWFSNLDNRSGLCGVYGGLGYYWVRGVSGISSEADAQKISTS